MTSQAMTLLITNFCNRECDYCFQNGAFNSKDCISKKDFYIFYQFCQKNNIKQVRIIGGEPTLHEYFDIIIKLLLRLGISVTFITNLICSPDKLKKLDDSGISALVNCNPPNTYTSDSLQIFNQNLKSLANMSTKVALSFTLSDVNQNLDYIFNCLKISGAQRLRFDLARPCITNNNKHVSSGNLKEYKQKIIEFLNTCKKEKIVLDFDCPFPEGFFSMNEIKELSLKEKGYKTKKACNFLLVKPDLSLGTCPHYHLLDKKLSDYKTIDEIYTDVNEKLKSKIPLRESAFCEAERFIEKNSLDEDKTDSHQHCKAHKLQINL